MYNLMNKRNISLIFLFYGIQYLVIENIGEYK